VRASICGVAIYSQGMHWGVESFAVNGFRRLCCGYGGRASAGVHGRGKQTVWWGRWCGRSAREVRRAQRWDDVAVRGGAL
jgi:hypothetical protein